jgi:quaternary ammonium compound-resistance protein SugE
MPFAINSWVVLLLAGVFEIGWPLGLKLAAQGGAMRFGGPAIAIACMAISGALLWLSLQRIPIGTAYAVWTGIGAVGTFLVGVAFFGDAAPLLRWAGIALIVGGITCLKLA